jgi:hypothetical protein
MARLRCQAEWQSSQYRDRTFEAGRSTPRDCRRAKRPAPGHAASHATREAVH